MEDVYTIKVKTKPDTRNLYPSERRYSASTVSGLAWVHIALAATSFLLAMLALVNPNSDIKRLTINDTQQKIVQKNELIFNVSNPDSIYENFTDNSTENIVDEIKNRGSSYILVLAPTLITVFALGAGIASIMASVRWYIDNNITWLFIMSILSTLFSFISFTMIIVWFITTSEGGEDITEFYKDREAFNYIVVKHTEVIERNDSHMIISRNSTSDHKENSPIFTKSVLSINILIAAFLELLWSILSVKISYKGMRSNYREDNGRPSNTIAVVTTIKGNNTKKLPRNCKLLPPKPDLIDHYSNKKIKRIFLAQNDNGFYLKNQNNKANKNTDTSSEFYKERMMNFLNRCASLEGVSNPEIRTPSVQSESVLNVIPEVNVEVLISNPEPEIRDRMTPISWGDTPDHTIYNQNNINFESLFKFGGKNIKDGDQANENDNQHEECSENKE